MENKKAFGEQKVEWIEISKLEAHPTVQRPLDKRRVATLAAQWDPQLCKPLGVVPHGVKYYVYDGQTRLEAARMTYGTNSQVLPCIVDETLSEGDEAKLFLGWNNTKTVKPYDKWLVRRIAEDDIVVNIEKILSGLNLHIVSSPHHAGGIRAVAALERIYMRPDGPNTLVRTLTVLKEAWGDTHDAYDALTLQGVAMVMQQFPEEITVKELAHKMSKHGHASALIGEARTLARVQHMSVPRAVAYKVVAIWNKGRGAKSKLELL